VALRATGEEPPDAPPPPSPEATRQPLYLTAIVGRGGTARALIANRDTGEGSWVGVNGEAFGLRLTGLRGDRATLEGGAGEVTLALGVGAPAETPPAKGEPTPAAAQPGAEAQVGKPEPAAPAKPGGGTAVPVPEDDAELTEE